MNELILISKHLPAIPHNTEYNLAKRLGVQGEDLKRLARKGRKKRNRARRNATLTAALAYIYLKEGDGAEKAWPRAQQGAKAGVKGLSTTTTALVWLVLEMDLLWGIEVPQGGSIHPRHEAFRMLPSTRLWWKAAADLQREIETLWGPLSLQGEWGNGAWVHSKAGPVQVPPCMYHKKLLLLLGREMGWCFSHNEKWEWEGAGDVVVEGEHVERAKRLSDAYMKVALSLYG